MAHGPFLMWEPGTGPLPTHAWQFQKCIEPHRCSPKKGMPGNKPSPSREGQSLGTQSSEAQVVLVLVHGTWMSASLNPCQMASANCHCSQDTTDLICVMSHTDWSLCNITWIILFNIDHFFRHKLFIICLHMVKWFKESLFNTYDFK